MKTVLIRLSGFAVLPLLSLVTPLLLLPIISTLVGSHGISSVISGQAIGTFGATAVMWGWNVDGPVVVARSSTFAARAEIYAKSMRTRLLLLVVVMPCTAAAAGAIAVSEFRFDAIAMAWATLLAGMSPAWFCIGLGQPRLLALFDTMPRFLSAALSAPLLLLTHQIWNYTALSVVLTTLSLIIFHRIYAPLTVWFPAQFRTTLRDLKAQKHTAGINLAGSSYAATPSPIATATTPPALSGNLSTADTLYRLGIFTIVSLGNAFQSWAIEPGIANRRQRHLYAIWAHAVLGAIGAAILTVFGPWVSSLLFAGQAHATTLICFYYGLSFFFLSASTPFMRNLLIPGKKQRFIFRWTIVSAIVGVGSMIAAGVIGSVEGVALGMAFSEAILCCALLIPAVKMIYHEGTINDQ